eukprot:TRINITY_DN3516_c2_g1_i1.p1 TRINITY_DN3516_c2_g1~~TRINITY_DN3516_c2_g1_i1.p1  ORF type:complete len:444 (+),score=75.90 TRINITY_DN3516_c2_g1_i1:152-1483(+)
MKFLAHELNPLELIAKHYDIDRVQETIQPGVHAVNGAISLGLKQDFHNVRLYEAEDYHAWVTFFVVFAALIVFDMFFLNKTAEEMTIKRALRYTLFWIGTAFAFCGWVWYKFGHDSAFMWMSGYMLEWMLSFDNLFVFHLIFTVYGTPDHLKHRPLYLGICGAIFFRLAFLYIGEYLMHAALFMHLVFGAFLIYTGISTITSDDEDEDPSKNPFVQWLSSMVPFISVYDRSGAFFVKVPVGEDGTEELSGEQQKSGFGNGEAVRTVDFHDSKLKMANQKEHAEKKWQYRATMLFLVVCCLEVSDMIFAVDSVSAIVAQVNDLFLAYSSAVFAMLGLRATFFIIDVLVHMFSLLKYGVAAVLVFIGVKLMMSHVYVIPPIVVCVVLVMAIGTSMVASVIQELLEKKEQGTDPEDVVKRVEHVTGKHDSPGLSPFIKESAPVAVM